MDRHTQARLKNDRVVWLVTAGRDRKPQAVPVWFLWDGKSFLIYAQPGIKVRHVRTNPYVELHLNTDESGNEVIRASGYATLLKAQRGIRLHPAYLRKYARAIRELGITPEDFARDYHFPIRVRRIRFH